MRWHDFKGFVPLILITFFWVCLICSFAFKSFRSYILESHKIKSLYSWTRMIGTFLVVSASLVIFIQMIMREPINVGLVTSMFGMALGIKFFHSTQNEKDNKKLKEKVKEIINPPNLEDINEEEKEKDLN